jgi:hypothetical protein
MDMKENLTCAFSHPWNIYFKFDIDINNDELLKIMWKRKKKKNSWSFFIVLKSVKLKLNSNYIAILIVTGNGQQHSEPKF